MIRLSSYLQNFETIFPTLEAENPWSLPIKIEQIIFEAFQHLNSAYQIKNNIAVHNTAKVEDHAILKGPAIIGKNCFIAAHAYLRAGVFLGGNIIIGPGCELKSSIILDHSTLAHFNFVGDSILGSYVNLEAGAVIANHYNEREQKEISVLIDGKPFKTSSKKFGALVGDHTKVGANAVLSPGTILEPRSIVKRLSLIEQCK